MIRVFTGSGEELKIEGFSFNGGEEHTRIANHEEITAVAFKIEARISTSTEVMRLLLVTDAIRRTFDVEKIDLHLEAIPYCCKTYVGTVGESFNLKVCVDLIVSQEYNNVFVIGDFREDKDPILLSIEMLGWIPIWSSKGF
jgi:ribose-phosphate pyrophosphokinase